MPSEDDSKVLIVNPEEVDLPWIKAMAAEQGVNVKASKDLPPGQVFLYDPKEMERRRGY